MTREDAKQIIYQLINSGILSEELEDKLDKIVEHLCADNFEKCAGNPYCGECRFLNE